jgi:hypothetical protein
MSTSFQLSVAEKERKRLPTKTQYGCLWPYTNNFILSPMAKGGVVPGIWCPALLSFLFIRSGNNHLKIVHVKNNVCNLSSLLYLAQSHFTVLRTS